MKPELPKVDINNPELEIRDSLEQAYLEDAPNNLNKQASPDLAKVGSVGIEAGLTDFEADKDGAVRTDDGSDDSQDDDESMNGLSPLSGTVRSRVSTNVISQTPAVAADSDDIGKEWVSKAKRIVEQTKSDPFLQERAVSRLQADYMKKRFNKYIKSPKGEN
jgi:hypothetical protein